MHVPGGSILIERDLLLVFVLNCKSPAVISQYNVYSSWHASMQINFTAADPSFHFPQLLSVYNFCYILRSLVDSRKRQAQLKAQCQLRVIIIVAEGRRYFQKKTTL